MNIRNRVPGVLVEVSCTVIGEDSRIEEKTETTRTEEEYLGHPNVTG